MLDTFTIRKMRPGSVLDGHVHDVLGFPEPVWPYSTHPRAQVRLWEWLKLKQAQVWLPGKDEYPGDDCVMKFQSYPRQHFDAVSINHALCVALLLVDYLRHHGRHFPIGGVNGWSSAINGSG